MKVPPHFFLLLLLVPALAGCSEKQGPGNGAEPTVSDRPSPTGSSSTTTSGGPLPPVVESSLLVLSDCTAFYAVSTYYPRGTGPGTAPQGWEPNDPLQPYSAVLVNGFECNRVSLGPFERGPVSFVLDSHSNASFPPDCRPNPTPGADIAVLATMIVSDPEIAAYLQQDYGMPATFGEIERETIANGPLNDQVFSWNLPNAEVSDVHIADDGTTQPHSFPLQVFWPRGNGIGSLNLTREGVSSQITQRPAYGTMRPPMMLADTADGSYAGPARFYPSLSAQGTFALYRDLLCKEPEGLASSP